MLMVVSRRRLSMKSYTIRVQITAVKTDVHEADAERDGEALHRTRPELERIKPEMNVVMLESRMAGSARS